ncbi:MAG TPA: hypothetical protein VMB84_02570 [Stellaceae bacterium]|nr:hypothetical protein [Stellaceae bacterium]
MSEALSLWNPGHVSVTIDLATALVLGVATPLHVHNLDTLGLPFALVVFTVLGVGVTTFVSATQAWRCRILLADGSA